jgi:hypothetical protein
MGHNMEGLSIVRRMLTSLHFSNTAEQEMKPGEDEMEALY